MAQESGIALQLISMGDQVSISLVSETLSNILLYYVHHWNIIFNFYNAQRWGLNFVFFIGKSCRIRWINQLNPRVDKRPFSVEEKQRLLELHREYGNRWSAIVSYFPGRTDNQVKNQYHILAGTRYLRASGSSSSTNPHGPLKKAPRGLSCYRSISTVPVGPQFSDVSCRGTNYCGFAPCFSVMPDRIEMRTSFIGGSSSVCGEGETFTQFVARSSVLSSLGPHSFDGVNLTSIYPHQRISRGNSIMSDANSAAFAELCPVPQPQQGLEIKDHQFIDFLRVGSSEWRVAALLFSCYVFLTVRSFYFVNCGVVTWNALCCSNLCLWGSLLLIRAMRTSLVYLSTWLFFCFQ